MSEWKRGEPANFSGTWVCNLYRDDELVARVQIDHDRDHLGDRCEAIAKEIVTGLTQTPALGETFVASYGGGVNTVLDSVEVFPVRWPMNVEATDESGNGVPMVICNQKELKEWADMEYDEWDVR